jgi:UDP-glucose:(heptosyl)LPS alpha-1,3-glucosyltransferase
MATATSTNPPSVVRPVPAMRVALVRREYTLRRGGAERYCVTLARQLMAQGHQVTIIGQRIDDLLASEVDFLPVRVRQTSSAAKNRSFARGVGEVIRQQNFDLVYGLSRSHGLDMFRLTDRLQAHWLNVYYRNGAYRALQRLNPRHRAILALERSIYQSPSVHRIVTQSKLDCRLVQHYYGVPEEKIRIIYNGVDLDTFHIGVRAQREEVRHGLGVGDDPLLVFAAMGFEGKGLETIFQAMAASTVKEARLAILGRGNQRKYQRMAQGLGIGDRVQFLGRRSDIRKYYGAADLFVLPTAYEPFPNVNLEAMACGCPVVTSATAGGIDVIQEGVTGYGLSDPTAVGELAEKLNAHFAQSEQRRQEMSQQCWRIARTMTAQNNARNVVETMQEVLYEKSRL